MHYVLVTETYPPEVNGVALTVQSLEHGLRERGRAVSLVRPRQDGDGAGAGGPDTLVRGVALPRYPGLRAGLPATLQLFDTWSHTRPDAIYIATEGPLGWSALRVARRLGIPAATGLHTRFDEYMRDYRVPWLEPVALGWMRHFHNSADATLVPTRELGATLHAIGFRRVRILRRAVDTERFSPSMRCEPVRARLGVSPRSPLVIHVGRLAAEKNIPLALRAFRQHAVGNDVLAWPGLQDITASVDFTALAEAGTGAGFDFAGYCSQAAFLFGNGLDRRLAAHEEREQDEAGRYALRQQAKQLTIPGGMGESFQAMGFGRDVDFEHAFLGGDLSHRL